MGWLCSDFDHRDPQDRLHDIDCGHYMSEMATLPGSILQLLEDSNMHAEVRLVNNRYRVVKIVKKREPEFLQGTERHFIYNTEGKRIPLTEDEFNEMLGLEGNPDDLFNSDEVDLETLDSEHVAPMDRWDVLYDATEFVQQAERLINNDNWQRLPRKEKLAELEALKKLIYSADWFPYPTDKRIHDIRAKKIAGYISEGLTKRQLGALIGPRIIDRRPQMVAELRAEAAKMNPGKEKAEVLRRAQNILDCVYRDRKNGRCMQDPIPDADRARLWAMWRTHEMKTKGEVQLMSWQFEKAYRHKLGKLVVDGKLSTQQANQMLSERMKELFNTKKTRDIPSQNVEERMPEWLQQEPPAQDREIPEENYEFSPTGWLHSPENLQEEVEEEWLQQVLLSNGEA